MKTCNKCGKSLDESCFYSHPNTKDKLLPKCMDCARKYAAKSRADNPDYLKNYNPKYYKKNAEAIKRKSAAYFLENREYLLPKRRVYSKRSREQNPDVFKKRGREYRKNNRPQLNARWAEWRAKKFKAMPAWANKFFMDEAYSLARLRTKMLGFKWEVDHAVPLNSEIVCGLHCEQNLQVIPATHNRAKNNRVWPDMP